MFFTDRQIKISEVIALEVELFCIWQGKVAIYPVWSAFKKDIKIAGVDMELVNYPGVKHSFTNPDADTFGKQFNIPLEYNANADKDSWERMQRFFNGIFGTK